MDTRFAKIVSSPDGRDHILIEGTVLTLAVDDLRANNRLVDVIVSGLRGVGNIISQDAAMAQAQFAANTSRG